MAGLDGEPLTAYLTTSDARTLAAGLPNMATLVAQDDTALGKLLLVATLDIDAAMRYQGRKYDRNQPLEFPRIAYGSQGGINQFGVPITDISGARQYPFTPDTVIWDWDQTNLVAVVPDAVKIACLYQAAWILNPANAQRLQAIRSGLTGQSIGSGSETYASAAVLAAIGGLSGLCDQSLRLMNHYQLRTGQML